MQIGRKILWLIKQLAISEQENGSLNLTFDGKSTVSYQNEYLERVYANNFIARLIEKDGPALICRIGATEQKAINNYLVSKLCADNQISINQIIVQELFTHSGVFPSTRKVFNEFSAIYLDSIKMADLFGTWNNVGEATLLNLLNADAKICKLAALEPYFFNDPWSAYLKDKKVLVIHPFSRTIKIQYNKRRQLFKNPSVLPDFHLIIQKSVQSLSNEDSRFKTWTEALDFMKQEVLSQDFDVALIGAGAFGLPLGGFVKSEMKKTAIHLGGALQILFGIRGKRWDDRHEFQQFFNEQWIYPLNIDEPKYGHLVDGYGPYTK